MESEITSPEYDQVCRQATCQIGQAVSIASAYMYDWDPATGLASVVAEYHNPEFAPRERRDELGVTYDLSEFPATLRCLVEGRISIVHADSADADMADRARLIAIDAKTAIRIPMITHDTVIGLIELCESRHAREWTADEIELCRTLADQAAMTIENARLRKAQHQQATLLTLLRDVTWRTSQVGDSNRAIQLIVESVANMLGYTLVDVMVFDETGHELVMRGAAGTHILSMPANYRQSVEQGIKGYVVRTGHSYMSNNVRHDPYYLSLEGWPRGSELAVPIQRAGKTIGVLNVESKALGAFSTADMTAMEILAGQLGAAMESAHLYLQTRQRLGELVVLHEIAVASTTASDVDTLLDRAIQVIAANLYSDNFGFLLLDEIAGFLRLHHTYHGVSPETLQMTIPLGQGITGHVAVTGTPLVVADVRADSRYIQLAGGVRSEMVAPLCLPTQDGAGRRVFGVLNVESRQPAAYSEDDLHLLVTIADQLAAAIERAQTQERAARAAVRLSVINQIGRKAAVTLDIPHLLQKTAETLHEELGYDYVMTAIVDQAARLIQPVGYAGGQLPQQFSHAIDVDHTHGVLSHGVTGGQAIYIPDTGHDPRCIAGLPDVRSELCVPICQSAETVIGLLDLSSRRLAAFDPDDIEAMKTLAGQLAVTVANVHLYDETQRRLRELSGLHELSKAFSLITDSDQLYGQITGLVARLLGVEQCGIVLYDPTTKLVTMQLPAYGLRPEQVKSYGGVIADPAPTWMRGETLLSNHPLQDAQTNPEILRDRVIELGERNLLAVPLFAGERCVGFVRVANKIDGSHFTDDDARLLAIFASQAAIAIENARFLANSQRRFERLAALQHVGAVLASSLELQPMVEALYQELAPVFNAQVLAVYMLDADPLAGPGGQRLQCESIDHGAHQSFYVEAASSSLGAHVTQTCKPLVVSDLVQERSKLPVSGITIGDPARSWLGVPLFLQGQACGAVTIQSYRPGRFGEEELWLMSQIAPQVTLAIQNIQSYRQTRRRVAELTALQRMSMRLGAVRDQTEAMYAIVEGVRSLIDATDVRIFRYDSKQDRLTLAAARSHYRQKSNFDVPPRSDGMTAQVARSGKPMVINEPSEHPFYAEAAKEWGLSAIVGIPIKRSDRTLAVLNVAFAKQPHRFTDDEVRILTMLADQAALAIENAALFESERQQRTLAEALRDMAVTISASLDLDEVLHRMLDQIRRVVEYDQASVGLILNSRLTMRALSGFPDANGLMLEWPINNLPLARQIVATAQPVLLADMQDPSSFPREIVDAVGGRKVRATMGIPIMSRGEVIGIIYLDSFQPNMFTFECAQQVQAFASQAAIAIVNAQFYRALSDQRPAPQLQGVVNEPTTKQPATNKEA